MIVALGLGEIDGFTCNGVADGDGVGETDCKGDAEGVGVGTALAIGTWVNG